MRACEIHVCPPENEYLPATLPRVDGESEERTERRLVGRV